MSFTTVLGRFLIRFACIVLIAIAYRDSPPGIVGAVAGLASLAAVCCVINALILRELIRAPSLTNWDEAAAHLVIALAVKIMAMASVGL